MCIATGLYASLRLKKVSLHKSVRAESEEFFPDMAEGRRGNAVALSRRREARDGKNNHFRPDMNCAEMPIIKFG